MKIDVYDFDKTIYDGDSTLNFYIFCLKKEKSIIKNLPFQVLGYIKYKLKIISKTKFKECFYTFFKDIKNIDKELNDFWEQHEYKMKKWYENKDHKDHVIISASPYFLLEPMYKKYKFKLLIASNVDKRTGKYDGLNCYGEEKVRRLRETYNDFEIDEFYSDSKSDEPLAKLAEKSYLIKKDEIIKWV